jgi:hypothetical protein
MSSVRTFPSVRARTVVARPKDPCDSDFATSTTCSTSLFLPLVLEHPKDLAPVVEFVVRKSPTKKVASCKSSGTKVRELMK